MNQPRPAKTVIDTAGAPEQLRMRLTSVRYAAAGIHLYDFRPLDRTILPAFTAGAHVDIHLPNGLVRQYSLVNPSTEQHRYVIGVKRDPNSRGGSAYIHEQLRVGAELEVGAPRNNFPLCEDASHSVFIAGGIGITPITCMIDRLRALGRLWELHYSVRRREEAAFVEALAGDRLHLHVDEECGGALLDVAAIAASAPPSAHLYCCGPAPMLDAFEAATRRHPAQQVHLERFSAAQEAATSGGFTVSLARSGGQVWVAPGQSILDALKTRGIHVRTSCEQGVCGTCETRVLAGRPDHRDAFLSDEEKAAGDVMMICCSASQGELLVLDL